MTDRPDRSDGNGPRGSAAGTATTAPTAVDRGAEGGPRAIDRAEWSTPVDVLVIDNYDSFVYNLVQYLGEFAATVTVRRNDELDIDAIRALDPDGIVVSPGPGTPESAGVSLSIFESLSYPTLGVCLGHQALCVANGLSVDHAPAVVHGKPSVIRHDGRGIFEGVASPVRVGRYHSLAASPGFDSDRLIETAWIAEEGDEDPDRDRVLMGVRHVGKPHIGVQFHPESILTEDGKRMIRNFCGLCHTVSTT